jgi:Methyltransferase domain
MPSRTDSLLTSIDVTSSKGLELGPLINPVVRRDMGDIRYIDHVDTDELRARYATHVGFDVDAIVPIDYVTHGSIYDTVGPDVPFDYVIASHVIEHVPDVIGWLGDIRNVLRDDGVLSLAIPDHRRCFDALRSPTVTADLIHAHLTKPTTPSPRQVFDHYSSAVAWRGLISWDQEPPFDELVPVHSEAEALERATTASTSGDYLDVHCWMFTPSSFTRLFGALTRLHLVPFSLESCSDTVGGEFFATLRVCDPAKSSAPAVESDDGLLPTASEDAAVRAQLRSGGPELQRVLASRSWQVTKPLRVANRQLARARNGLRARLRTSR